MGSFKSAPLPALLLLVLLGAIVAILIAPEIDLPDTAFQRDSSPLSVHAQAHQGTQVNPVANARHVSSPDPQTPFLALQDRSPERLGKADSAPPFILRC
jgi:hypothetical protein